MKSIPMVCRAPVSHYLSGLQQAPTKVSFKPIANGAEYISFRASAPAQVQSFLDLTYSQMAAPESQLSDR